MEQCLLWIIENAERFKVRWLRILMRVKIGVSDMNGVTGSGIWWALEVMFLEPRQIICSSHIFKN